MPNTGVKIEYIIAQPLDMLL